MSLFKSHADCITHLVINNSDWNTLYGKYMTNILRIIDEMKNISRLYLLIQLDLSNNDLITTYDKLQIYKLCQPPEAVEMTNNLKDILSEVDPIYLDLAGEIYVNDQGGLALFIEEIVLKKKTYPKIQEYNDRIKDLNAINNVTKYFNIEKFLEMCPDPENYFKNIKINSKYAHYHESLSYLREKFDRDKLAFLSSELASANYNLTNAVENIKSNSNRDLLRNKRKLSVNIKKGNYKTTLDIEFLKEIAYIDHKEEILNFIEVKKNLRTVRIEQAKADGQLCSCDCCYDDELLSSDVHLCPVGHSFCSTCIKKGVEVSIGANKIDIKCFANCDEELNLNLIENIIDKKLFEHILKLKQSQEIMNAKIEGLETCAFCNYSVILPTHVKTINCLNPECKKETCRKCREESHFPYRCDEIEKAPEVRVRTMVENKMSEVLIRCCYHCNQKFVKEDGCNKMTCSCGRQMCYICRVPLDGTNYTHFYHSEVMENKCPLYIDENVVHTIAIEAAARLILNELKSTQPELLSRIDIDKILPELKNSRNISKDKLPSPLNVPEIVAKLIGQNVEDVENLRDMRSLDHQPKRARRL